MRYFPVLFAAAILVAIVGMSANATDTVVRCGHVSERTPASFVLSAPSVDPLRVVIPSGMVSAPPDYTCVSVLPGRPAAQLVALLTPDMPGYIAEN
ncbi:MAG TPA: hypothetical protein VFQ66_08480 [Candidatus Limnocylindria bacterium]|nr:hypothetical protein [Candidatus Limnocylindria bacterium]